MIPPVDPSCRRCLRIWTWRSTVSALRRAVVAFMRWQQGRGVLNSLDDDMPGSPWWRAVNENLLRDTVEAKLIVQRGEGQPSWPSVAGWVNFFNAPSAQSWYGAHNGAGWLRSRLPVSDSS